MSRERIFHLADRILAELQATEGLALKGGEDIRVEVVRTLTDETKLEESVDQEARRTLGSYTRPLVEGSAEWEVLYQKTREEILKKRLRL